MVPPKSLLARKLLVAFMVGFGGVFIPAALNVLDRVATGSPSGVTRAFLYSLVAGAFAAGLRATLALSPLNLVSSDSVHTVRLRSRPQVRRRTIAETRQAGKPLGRHVEHDSRSRLYPAERATGALVKVQWRRYGSPFNQGQLGSCTGNAIAGALNTAPLRPLSRKLLTEHDAVRLYELATQLDGIAGVYPPSDTGSSGLAACKAAKQLGLIAGYTHAFGIQHALAALQLGPVITGVPWYEGFDQPDANGLVQISGRVRGGHEFEVIGYDPATDLVEAVNSWGKTWGVNGHFFFTSKTWSKLLAQQGDVTVPQPLQR